MSTWWTGWNRLESKVTSRSLDNQRFGWRIIIRYKRRSRQKVCDSYAHQEGRKKKKKWANSHFFFGPLVIVWSCAVQLAHHLSNWFFFDFHQRISINLNNNLLCPSNCQFLLTFMNSGENRRSATLASTCSQGGGGLFFKFKLTVCHSTWPVLIQMCRRVDPQKCIPQIRGLAAHIL